MNTVLPDDSTSYRRIERVIAHIDRHHADKPGLEELAKVAGLSVFHFSREFRRWAGLSPTRYLRAVALSVARRELDDRGSVLTAAWADDPAVRAVLLRAEGRSFCVGGDLKTFADCADLPALLRVEVGAVEQ